MSRLSFGIKTAPQHTTYPAMLEVWRAADALPVFEHAWLFDHFNPIGGSVEGPCFEGWITLAALAAQTQRIRIGVMVTGNTYRHPAVLAHMAATLDVISNGRLDFGLGAGWNEYEHQSMGLPLPAPRERIERLAEACELIKRLFTLPVADFDGQYYRLRAARCDPKPVQQPYPPFVIGGGGERRTLRVVAQHADIWNFAGGSPEEFARKVAVLRHHCAEVGRDPATIRLSVQVRVNVDDLAQTTRTLRDYVAAGATHLVLMLAYPYPRDIVARLAEEVVARVQA